MKTTKLLLAATLALAVLGGLIWVLAWRQPTTAKAQASAEDVVAAPLAPQILPPPWLSDDDVADAPFSAPNIWPPPAIDGFIAPGEYAHAGKVTFPGYGGYYHEVEVFFNQDGSYLYVAFDLPALDPSTSNYADIYLDTDNDGGGLDASDYWLRIRDDGVTQEYTAITGSWMQVTTPVSWTGAATTTLIGGGWQAEFAIEYGKLGITPGTFKELGLAVGTVDGGQFYWPSSAHRNNPNTWGSLISSSGDASIVPSGWGTFYWKPGPWEDYAPSGMPDFDQKQDAWWAMGHTGPVSTHCGPVAMANSLWWFDSKFETLTDTMPPVISDTYRLVQSYGPGMWDDHYISNTVPLVDDLANKYFNTNDVQGTGGWAGTYVTDMHSGTIKYLRDHGLWDDYIVTLVEQPDFKWVADEVQRSEDVILLLGFYEWRELEMRWARVGGHYVNVAGVDPWAWQIAFSDPYIDNAEAGGLGRVLSGTLILPHTPGHPSYVHNDAGNVSHDVYTVIDTTSPGGTWGPAEYPLAWEPWPFLGANPHPEIPTEEWLYGEVYVEVEFALAVSPHTWKSSGEWIPEGDDPIWGFWQPWQDYAPSGVPDFDQKQDNWGYDIGTGWKWSFCGPAAAANSLWWFDSKFEPNPVSPLPYNDNYPLVQTYSPIIPSWDDHDPLNVDYTATPWPPGGEFVEDLALRFDTDGVASGAIHAGTLITDVYTGIEQYITDHGLRQGYVITQVKSPEFWWVAEEVEHSEDVILLMGFWQWQGPDGWVRLGGHYVTVPGADKQGGFVAFSDPWFDRIGQTWPYAGIGSVAGWPSYMGRVADGWLTPHPPYGSHASTVHNDAGNVSHDVYNVIGTDSPGGVWGPEEYVDSWGSIENFWGQNGQEEIIEPTGDPIQAEVEWAVAVSPVADVWVAKGFDPTTAAPGDWITLTIRFRNDGSLLAEDVVITDTLPSELVNTSWSHWTSNGLAVTARPATTYVWDLPDLKWTEWGVITVTAQVDPSLSWPLAMNTITNTVKIGTSSLEQYQIPEQPNVATATLTVRTADVVITKSVVPPTLRAGDWLTYTLVYTNHSLVTAANTVITDLLHSWLVTSTSSYSIWTSYPSVVPIPTDRYIWPIGDVPASGWGIIAVTAQVSPSLSGGGVLPNTASIATTTPEWDYTNNSASASNTVVYYGVDLQPDTGSITENPGKTVTYTLMLYNTGNITDEYKITGAVAGETWMTHWPDSAGPVAGGGSTQFTVTVQISSTAATDDWSRATITATSKSDASKWDTSVLTTTAYSGTITHGVEVAPHAAAQAGHTGTTVTYTLRVTNTGTVADVIGLSHTDPSTWTVGYSDNPLSLLAGAGQAVEVYVGIPPGTPGSATRVITVTATSQGDPTESDAAVLTTSVLWRFIYLPLVLRNY